MTSTYQLSHMSSCCLPCKSWSKDAIRASIQRGSRVLPAISSEYKNHFTLIFMTHQGYINDVTDVTGDRQFPSLSWLPG